MKFVSASVRTYFYSINYWSTKKRLISGKRESKITILFHLLESLISKCCSHHFSSILYKVIHNIYSIINLMLT